jgi:hypothetical protein
MKVMLTVLLILVFIVGSIGIVFALNALDLFHYEWFNTKKANADHEIFKENTSHVEGMISDLSKYKKEYDTAIREKDTETARAVIQYIKTDFSNFDSNKIENESLRLFLNGVFNGEFD